MPSDHVPSLARRALVVAAAVAALSLAACGDDEPSESEEAATVTPEQAITEIGEVRSGLDESLVAYEDGDAEAAEQLAGDAYLEHFELVEGPLEEADEELNEELEELIREELRNAIVEGEPTAAVEKLVDRANVGLDRAERALEGTAT